MSELRASDADRERAAAALRDHFAAGRLTQDEFDERLQAVYAAREQGKLRELTADLPALPASPAERRAELAARRAHLQRRLLHQAGGAIVPFVICTAVWLASGAQGQFWPVWVALVAIVPLLRGGWALYGPAPDLDRFERELEAREERRSARRQRRELRDVQRDELRQQLRRTHPRTTAQGGLRDEPPPSPPAKPPGS